LKFDGAIGGPAAPGSANFGAFSSLNHFNECVTESDALLNFPDVSNSALIAARNNLKASKINLGVAFGERKQTARLVGDTASRIARSIRSLKRGSVRNAMNELGISSKRHEPRGSNIPRKWLELQYGWKPLLSDVYGATKALSERPLSDWSVTTKGRSSDRKSWTVERKPGQWYNFDGFRMTASASASAICRIDAIPQNEAIISLASLGVTNPLSVGWELVPFSFVVDWFLPIGSYLESLDAYFGFADAWSCTSYFVVAEWKGQGLSEKFGTNGGFIENNWRERKRVVKLVRSVSSGIPLPTFPSLKDPRSLGHMANGLSLLTQIFR
jgi:hypothetical protein